MISKKIHIGVKVFLKSPYVVRLAHPTSNFPNMDLAEFLKIRRSAQRLIHGAWGYSSPEYETLTLKEELTSSGLPPLSTLFSNQTFLLRSYWVFEYEMDALQFRLSVGETAQQVHMWPQERLFTIYTVGT